MDILNLEQGSPEWHAHRASHRNASDTPAVMGCSPYKTRSAFLEQRATGIEPEIDAATQRRFDDGHQFEALARPLMEKIIGEDLYPVVGVDGVWSASFDGLTADDETSAEHKTLNDDIRACASIKDLPLYFRVQMEHQLMVAGAKRSLFMATKWKLVGGTWELAEEKHFWYEPDLALRQEIIAAWAQFDKDVAAYVPEAPAAPAAVGEVVKDLPAVYVNVSGSIDVADNFKLFEEALRDFIESRLIRDPQTDQDFADLDLQIKALKRAEDALDAAETQMIAQVASVDGAKRTKDMLHKLARDNRLMAEKLLEAEKNKRRQEIVQDGIDGLAKYVGTLKSNTGNLLPEITGNFGAVIKGLRTLESMREKVKNEVARCKALADTQAQQIQTNLAAIEGEGHSWRFLFPDLAAVCTKQPEDFAALLAMRIASHKAAEEKRLEAERQRIRAEEQAKAQREAAEATAKQQAEEALNQRQATVVAQLETVEPNQRHEASVTPLGTAETPWIGNPKAAPQASDDGPTVKLGEICAALGYTVSAEFLEGLGFTAKVEKTARLYQAKDFPAICRRIADHTLKVAFNPLTSVRQAA